MQKIREKNFKSIAKEAKNRLKSGFWENCKDEFRTDVARAKNAGISESRAGRYFAGKITCTVATTTPFTKRSKPCCLPKARFPTRSAG